MSSEDKSRIPSNEEVIEELTKDLKKSAIKTDDEQGDYTSHHSESDSESDPHNIKEETEIRDEDYIDDKIIQERDEKLSKEEIRVCNDSVG